MRDKRPVDELSVEELERILAVKRREVRQQRLQKMERSGRLVDKAAPEPAYLDHNPAPAPAQLTVPALEALTASVAASLGTPQTYPSVPDTSPRFEDGDEEYLQPVQVYAPVPSKRKTRVKRTLDRVLLFVEVAAVIGIIVIGYSLFSAVGDLERETAAAQALSEEQRRMGIPTLAPTPSMQMEDYILPGGHTASGQFNYDEVPPQLLGLVESQWMRPVISRQTVTSETPLSITIPDINVSQSIVQGVDWEALKQGVGQLPNAANPGDVSGNVVLAAHNDIYGQIFRYLDQLEAGDQFQITTQSQVYTYTITDILYVEPTDVHVLENRGTATATLISCWPYQVNNQRIVVMADRVA